MAIILTIGFIIIYIYGLFRWNKLVAWRLNSKVSKTIKYTHYSTLFVTLTIAFTYFQYGVGLRGLWTTRTFVIIALLTGILFNFVTDKTINNKIEKIYFKLFSFLPAITGMVLCVPFLGVIIVISLFGRLIEPVNKIYFEDENLRINSSFKGVLAPQGFDIFSKNSIFETKLDKPDFGVCELCSVIVSYDTDSTRIIVYGHSKEDKQTIISIDKQK